MFHAYFAVMATITAINRNAWYYRFSALFAKLLFVICIGALFDRIG